ncbi:hypothetical protein HID58_021220 [Brassica napus]|uniref:Uncharacterized protein n=1 Tax=Brassica napus TaxID=3708 RepID=A0ABQ8CWM0_BRANA|nr:hypothetical protein HID58_021220 [Brassica napus]
MVLISILKGHPDLQNLKASHCISKKVFNRSDVTPSVFESSILLTVMALMIEGLSNEYISKCSRLLRLKLGLCANISDKGIFHIGSKCSKLLELDLYRCAGFGDDGLAAISRVIDGSTTPSSLMRSLSLPILPSTATECLEGLEISETQTPLGTDVRVTMEKASLSITSTLQSDTTNQLLLTSSAPLVASYETSLLETVVPPLTSEAVIVQVRDTPPPSLASVISINAVTSDVPTSQQAPSETLGSHSHDDSRVQASEKFVPSLGSWAKPLFFKPPATPPDPSTPRDYDPAFVGNQLATLWPTLNDEILNKQPKGNKRIMLNTLYQLSRKMIYMLVEKLLFKLKMMTPMEVSASAFSDYMGNTITRYGTRRGAQLRYPSHQLETNLSGGNPLWGLGGPHDAPASLIPLRSSQPVDLVLVSSHLPCRPCPLRCFISIQRKWCVLPLLHQAELTAGFYRSNGHDRYDAFTVFVRNMNQVKLSSYDQAVEDEA